LIGEIPRELTISEIVELEKLFALAVERARKAGFDGIEIHGAHGYLIAQFVSPLSNQRQDWYGGNLENRLRFSLNLIKTARKAVGQDSVLGYRISGDEHVPGGLTLDETAMISAELAKAGLDYIHLSSGRREAMRWVHPAKEGAMLGEAEKIKKAVNVPLICPNIYTPEVAIKAIEEKKTDLVSLGRQLLADPKWASKVREGRFEDVQACTRCRGCIRRLYAGLKISCSVNRFLGHENYVSEYWPPYGHHNEERGTEK
jgi:2,4-dienoyl-CoA reductase-like NADH-dependent reductase (Old Yellow Enzyme family)